MATGIEPNSGASGTDDPLAVRIEMVPASAGEARDGWKAARRGRDAPPAAAVPDDVGVVAGRSRAAAGGFQVINAELSMSARGAVTVGPIRGRDLADCGSREGVIEYRASYAGDAVRACGDEPVRISAGRRTTAGGSRA